MVEDKFRFLNFVSKNPVTYSGRSISGQFSLTPRARTFKCNLPDTIVHLVDNLYRSLSKYFLMTI